LTISSTVHTRDETAAHGVKFMQVIEAFYEQGKKDGRREMIERMDSLKSGVKYLPPGQPRKKRKTKTSN